MRKPRWIPLIVAALSAACGDESDDEREQVDAGAGDAAARVDARADDFPEYGPDEDIPVDPALPDGQVIAPWDAYCVATFERDFEVTGAGGTPAFTANVGDRYLLGADDFFSDATLLYITDAGAASFKLDFGGHAAPFDSSCGGSPDERIGVFVDTIVYADADLATPACTVQAGQTMPSSRYSFSLSGQGYSVTLPGLARLCDGLTEGYVAPVRVETDGLNITSLPFIAFSAR